MRAALPSEDLDLALSLTAPFWSQFGGSRILITGGTGFIGAWLLQVLQRANDQLRSKLELVVLTRDADRARQQSPQTFARADTQLASGDVRHFATPLGPLDLCIHAAAEVGDTNRPDQPLQVFDGIVQGTRRMLDLAQTAGVRRFLLTSSGAVYGPQPADLERMPESFSGAPDPLSAAHAYGNGKRAAEWLACAYAAQAAQAAGTGFTPTIARIFAVIGPGLPLDGPFAAGNFIRDALAGRAIQVNGDGTPVRSFLYSADVCVWLFRILGSGVAGQAYNVGSEQALSIAELAQRVAASVGQPQLAVPLQTANAASGPPARYVPDTSKARQELGLSEYTTLDAALQKTMAWTRQAAFV
ncbi:MAG: NAD(P)-dependent oxidoreductase [Rhodoferax sp.]|nr:NAD(P)-dependent oxidoreductase [Rhodoferax sp.]